MTERLADGEQLPITALNLSDAVVRRQIEQLLSGALASEADFARYRYFACWETGQLAAVVAYTLAEEQLQIHHLMVQPSFAGQGLASRLLAHLLTNLRWRQAQVELLKSDNPAEALFRKFGFTEPPRRAEQTGPSGCLWLRR